MTQAIPFFVFFESVTFIVASLIHFGVLIDGYEHQKAGIAESVIGIVLLIGWVWTWVRIWRRSQPSGRLAWIVICGP